MKKRHRSIRRQRTLKTANIETDLMATPLLTAPQSNAVNQSPTVRTHEQTLDSQRRGNGIVALLRGAIKSRPESKIPVADSGRQRNFPRDRIYEQTGCGPGFSFWRFRIVSWPRLMSICHLAGIFSQTSSSGMGLRTFQPLLL